MRLKDLHTFIIQRKFELSLLLIVMTSFLAMSYVALMRHWSLGSYHFDLGNMLQAVANTASFRFLQVTDPLTYVQSNRLAYHFDPIMAVIAPFYALYPYAETLIVIQALVLALGAVPVYLLGKKIFGEKMYGLVCACVYALYYPIHFTALFDFHSVTFGTTLILWMLYFAEIQRFRASFVCIVLLWLTKENIPFITAFFGLYEIFIKRHTKFGIAVFCGSVVTFLIVMGAIIPFFRSGQEHFAEKYFSTHVMENIQMLLRAESLSYTNMLLFPVGYIALLSPITLLIALPEFLINILSKNGNMRVLQYHYTALLSPFIIMSVMYGLRSAAKRIKDARALPVASAVLLGYMVILTFFKSPLVYSGYHINVAERNTVLEWQQKLADPRLKISTSGHLSPYFAGREYFYNFFFDFAYKNQAFSDDDIKRLARHYEKADYVLIKESELTAHPLVQYYYKDLISNPDYEKIFDKNGLEVYKRKSSRKV